ARYARLYRYPGGDSNPPPRSSAQRAAGGPRGADRGGVVGVFGDREAAEQGKPLLTLHEAENPRQLAGEHDVLKAAGTRGGQAQHADRFDDHVHDRERLVLGSRVGGDLAEVRGGGAGRQVAQRATRDVAHGKVDAGQVAALRQRFERLQRRDPEHVLGEPAQRAAAEPGAAEVLDLVAVDRDQRGAGAERNHQRVALAAQRGPADSDRGEFANLDHRPPEQG